MTLQEFFVLVLTVAVSHSPLPHGISKQVSTANIRATYSSRSSQSLFPLGLRDINPKEIKNSVLMPFSSVFPEIFLYATLKLLLKSFLF